MSRQAGGMELLYQSGHLSLSDHSIYITWYFLTGSQTVNFGSGSIFLPIHLTLVFCSSLEQRLADCITCDPTLFACSHHEDAGVRCQPGECRLLIVCRSSSVNMTAALPPLL